MDSRFRALLLSVVLTLVLALVPSVAHATYTGVQDDTTFGSVAAAAGWVVVPQFQDNSDPGEIDGTPFDDTTSSLQVARVVGPRSMSFRSVSAGYSTTMGPMLVAGTQNVLAVAWSDSADGGRIDSATLSASGNLSHPVIQTGVLTGSSLRLAVGPDGAYALSWRDAAGEHALAAPAGEKLAALLGPDVALDPGDRVVLSGGDAFWLVKEAAGGLSAAPAVFGQNSASQALSVGAVGHVTTLGDPTGGLWVLAQSNDGWTASHIDRTGKLSSTALPAAATQPAIALAGTTAVIAYAVSGPHCATYIQRLHPAAAPGAASSNRVSLTPRATRCSTPKAIAVDPSSATAYVLVHSSRGTTLATETTSRRVSSWRGSLREQMDGIVAAGSDRVVVESSGPQRNIGEQCGGAASSSSQSYLFRVFHGVKLERTGRLQASVTNC